MCEWYIMLVNTFNTMAYIYAMIWSILCTMAYIYAMTWNYLFHHIFFKFCPNEFILRPNPIMLKVLYVDMVFTHGIYICHSYTGMSKTLKHHEISFYWIEWLINYYYNIFASYWEHFRWHIYMPFVHGNTKSVKIWLNRLESIVIWLVGSQTPFRPFPASYSKNFRWHICMPFVHKNGKCIKSWSKIVMFSYTNGIYICHLHDFQEMENIIETIFHNYNLRKPRKISFLEKVHSPVRMAYIYAI